MYKLNSLSYSFSANDKSGKAKKIFLDKPLTLSKNELVAIVGPSGGGKSTLLKVLKGIIPEYSSGDLSGDITFENRSLDGVNFQKNLSKILYLFQNPFSQLIYPNPEEEFLFSMENFNFTKAEMNMQKEKFEAIFNLQKIWGKKNSELSNGECQKLVLASLLAINPQVLLLDEPTAFLDPAARAEFYAFLNHIRGDRLVIIVDHHVEEIKNIVTKVIEVSIDGKISEISELKSKTSTSNVQVKPFDLDSLKLENQSQQSLKIEDVDFYYDKKNILLNKINAEFKSGEIIAIKGINGAGKSTLFKIIAEIIKPKSGKVSFGKNKIFNQTGFIFQNPEAHFFYDTIEEELKQSFKNISSDALKSLLLERFFNDIDLKKSPFLLSEGEKRRLSILMTVFLGKGLLLYDEPTFGQDYSSVEEISSLMRELKNLGIVQVFISHDEEFISKTADRAYILEAGGLNEISRT
jgi:energy-coupling factor transporter ATP-binding protein EcfA2